MSGLDLLRDADLAPEREEVVPAPRRRWWRNKMQAKEEIVLSDYTYKAGDLFQAGPDYPSEDTARAGAVDFLSHALDAPRDDEIIASVVDYIGPIPFDENGEAP